MSTPDAAPPDAGAIADEMRAATERLREQAWMVAGTTRAGGDASEAEQQLAP